ncbi:homocysteine S-methyltransferase [Enterococcus bulliens]
MNIETFLQEQDVMLIDGSMSLGLEEQGLDLNDPLWTAKALMHDQEKVIAVHQAYFEAGANIAITNSYQATIAGFEKLGIQKEQGRQLIKQTVELAKQARTRASVSHPMFVAGSVGPYGAYLADGSEYRGNYGKTKEELKVFHKERMDLLIEAGADLLACETMPDHIEIEALLELLAESDSIKAWVTMTLKDATHLSDGTPLAIIQKKLEASPYVLGYGINCVQPDLVSPTLMALAKLSEHKPFVTYPNSGAVYDPVTKTWTHAHQTEQMFTTEAKKWHELGCRFIGGCCCTSTREIKWLTQTFRSINRL